MKIERKIKTFENYESAGGNPPKKELSDAEINEKIKEIVSNVIKCKQYFELLQDTAEHVYTMLEKQLPPNSDAFISTLQGKDSLLSELMEALVDILDNSSTLTELDEITMNIRNLDKYTEDNMDAILSGKMDLLDDDDDLDGDDDDEFVCPKCKGYGEDKNGVECDACDGSGYKKETLEEEDEEEDDDEEYIDIMKPKDKEEGKAQEDQLKRKQKPTNENFKRRESFINKDIEAFLQKVGSEKPKERPRAEKPKEDKKLLEKPEKRKKFGYLNGIYATAAKKLNGRKVEIICKTQDMEDCYDLYDPLTPGLEGEVNIKGMPSKYIFKEKPTEIIDTPPKKERVRATKKK